MNFSFQRFRNLNVSTLMEITFSINPLNLSILRAPNRTWNVSSISFSAENVFFHFAFIKIIKSFVMFPILN